MNPIVTVYSKPACMPCKLSKRVLDQGGVIYIEHDVTANHDAANRVRELGYAGVPVVTVDLEDGTDHWYGFDRTRLAAVVEIAGAASQ